MHKKEREIREREVNQEGLNQRTILDDTTKIIYGMKTTSFISKENFLLSDTLFLILDSTLNDIYDISIPEKNQFKYQNLGNLGSPVRIFFMKSLTLFHYNLVFLPFNHILMKFLHQNSTIQNHRLLIWVYFLVG